VSSVADDITGPFAPGPYSDGLRVTIDAAGARAESLASEAAPKLTEASMWFQVMTLAAVAMVLAVEVTWLARF
jgi:hypothetical protein